jgi:hypothetical protein
MRIDNPVVLFWWQQVFHGTITQFRKRQLAAKAFMVEGHCLSTISIK